MKPNPAVRAMRLALKVRDLERTLAFYRELGLVAHRRGSRAADLELGDRAVLSIEQADATSPEPRVELRLETDDLAALLQLARRVGPTRREFDRGFAVVDPDGIHVQVDIRGARDRVDEASRESFPASDAPAVC